MLKSISIQRQLTGRDFRGHIGDLLADLGLYTGHPVDR